MSNATPQSSRRRFMLQGATVPATLAAVSLPAWAASAATAAKPPASPASAAADKAADSLAFDAFNAASDVAGGISSAMNLFR